MGMSTGDRHMLMCNSCRRCLNTARRDSLLCSIVAAPYDGSMNEAPGRDDGFFMEMVLSRLAGQHMRMV
jgi:hypothetical protein